MLQTLKDIPLKFKLITCFLVIILINGISGYIAVSLMRDLGELVNVTYDKALMSGTFAQAVKFDFSQYDSEIKSALMADTEEDFKRHVAKSSKAYKTLIEDLEVVKDRTLSSRSVALAQGVNINILEFDYLKELILEKKKLMFNKPEFHKGAVELTKEWEASKYKANLYKKITALYDDAAEVGYQFRLSSEETTNQNLKRTIAIVIACVVISLGLSIAVSYFIILPLLKLQETCKIVGEGNYAIRSDIQSKDELGTLATSFNFMLNTIQEKTDSMTSLLSSLPFGLFYFDESGVISKERSQSTDLIFKDFSKYKTLADFFSLHNCNAKQIDNILKAIFKGMIPFDSAVYLFPHEIQIEKGDDLRTISLSFKPKFGPKKKIEKVILIAEDITEKNKALAESKAQTERVLRVSCISSDISGFREFLPASKKLFQSVIQILNAINEDNEKDLKRDLHSLKGMLSVYSFNQCAEDIHEIESLLEVNPIENSAQAIERLSVTYNLFDSQVNDVSKLLALDADINFNTYSIHKINIIKKIAAEEKNLKILDALNTLDKYPIEKLFSKYATYAQAVTTKLEDKKVVLDFDSSDELSYEEVQRIDPVVIHILNNSIDHGIETMTARKKVFKDATGKIIISCKRNLDALEFRISDDGKGIDGDKLLEKALEKGLLSEEESKSYSKEEKHNLIFASGFSTKDETSQLSGRGVGMDSVKAYLESMGGSIHLETTPGQGTLFSFTIPHKELFNESM